MDLKNKGTRTYRYYYFIFVATETFSAVRLYFIEGKFEGPFEKGYLCQHGFENLIRFDSLSMNIKKVLQSDIDELPFKFVKI